MYKLVDFCNWMIDEDTPFGSGASEKNWLIYNQGKEANYE